MKKQLSLCLMLFAAFAAEAQLTSYAVAAIPETIRKNANLVKRYEDIYLEITDIDRAVYKEHSVYTVLNAQGADILHFARFNSKFDVLVDVEIKVYDEYGKQLSRFKKKDLMTSAYNSGLINDMQISYLNVPASSYPITVEYIVEEKRKGSLHFPTYYPIKPDEGVLQTSFTAKVPRNLDLRYKERNISLAPKVTEEEKYKTYVWAANNLQPFEKEEGSMDAQSLYPRIDLAATRFKMDDYEGDMTTWKGLGEWYNKLHVGLDELPDDRKAFLRNLVKDAKDDREKVRIIYQYMQQNFRYVSIQLGIGGWRSLSATFTDQKKYGDCKGLTNYMLAALKAVGIRSHAALINADYDSEPVDPSFPMSGFNHVILCVPQPKDSIWLECTSKTNDFAVLGTFTENRNALLCTEQGGALVATPRSNAADNQLNVSTVINLDGDGSGKTVTSFHYTGEYKDRMEYILDEKKDDQKESIVYGMGFKQPDEFVVSKKTEGNSSAIELALSLEKVPEFIAGSKMFFSPRLYKFFPSKLPKADKRKNDYVFHYPFQKRDTTVIKLPTGCTVDGLPQAKELQCKYATYATKYWFDESQKAVFSSASLTLTKMRIPVADYAEVKKFFDDVAMDEGQRIVVKKP